MVVPFLMRGLIFEVVIILLAKACPGVGLLEVSALDALKGVLLHLVDFPFNFDRLRGLSWVVALRVDEVGRLFLFLLYDLAIEYILCGCMLVFFPIAIVRQLLEISVAHITEFQSRRFLHILLTLLRAKFPWR